MSKNAESEKIKIYFLCYQLKIRPLLQGQGTFVKACNYLKHSEHHSQNGGKASVNMDPSIGVCVCVT